MDTLDLVMLGLAVIGLTILMRTTFRRVTRVTSTPRPNARSEFARLEEERKARNDVEQVMLELDQVARQIQGQLDTRFAKLEAVIRDADARIEHLTRLLGVSHPGNSLDVTIHDSIDSAPTERKTPDAVPTPHAQVYRLADAGIDTIAIAKETGKPIGEIDLILALRRTKQHHSTEAAVSTGGSRT